MKIILATAGEIACGKETFAKYVLKKYGGSLYRFSDPLREILDRMHLDVDRDNLHRISMALRRYFGQDILFRMVYNDIKKSDSDIIILDAARRLSDIKHLKKFKGFRLIFIDASLEKRFGRLRLRGEKADDKKKSLRVFKKEHDSEVERKIRTLKKKADFVIENDGTPEQFYKNIDEVIKKIINK